MEIIRPDEMPLGDYREICDFTNYVQGFWKVSTKTQGRRRFLLTAAQRIVEYEISGLQRRGIQPRVKVIKARRQGISTYSVARNFQRISTIPYHKAYSIADKLLLPQEWLRWTKQWYNETPRILQHHLAASNAIEMWFDQFGSQYTIASQLGQKPGMGLQLHDLHCSELAAWGTPQKIMDDLLPGVPKFDPNSSVIWESTGELAGDWWHNQILMTLDGADDFIVIFLPWFITAEYRTHPGGLTPEQYTDEEHDVVRIADQWAEDHPEHRDLAEFGGITPGQIAWRRWVIANEFSGDTEMFQSKYPAVLSESFLGVGNMALPLSIVQHHTSTARPAPEHVLLVRHGDRIVPEKYEGQGPHWEIWNHPESPCEYAIGGDVAQGALSDRENERSERDFSSAPIMNRRRLRFDAVFHGRLPPDLFGQQMRLGAEYYNWAYAGAEVNDAGWAVVVEFKDYPHVLMRMGAVDDDDERDITKMFWKTTPSSRKLLISDWRAACAPSPQGGYGDSVEILSERLVAEEKTFILKASGKAEHRNGCFDDELFGHMIAWQVHLQCPHIRESSFSAENIVETQEGIPAYSYVGGRDPVADDEEE